MATQEEVNYQRIEKAIVYLEENFLKQPSLLEVAEEASVSPYHFQRLFSEWAGISPKRFMQFLTVDFLKEKLHESRNLIELAETAGLSGQARIYDLFTSLEAVTPQEYKQSGAGLQIDYGFHETTFGLALIGTTKRGVCWLSFVEADTDRSLAIATMQAHWHQSTLLENKNVTQIFADNIFTQTKDNQKLHVLVKGTNFQVKVWEALLRIPVGAVTTYKQVAESIGNPNAMQAVGSAVGANHIAYLIPCHRVIRKDGILGEYRWQPVRKKSMIGLEMARYANQSLTVR
ncbi:methylated-DNA--protein-cysteine methyltransferase [Chryseotalea sanaruensis]|jgi:AraC family transcriptional regulator of adaptative response/methylated-DNA-[protein]-cysteine methyltransferase|uniref:methylated-DNA--[protein]-cysteine S-methyltransferase n=1 Tax=Chryseotalea sanaruensis TaxID=2482724 RepID=A0A401UCG0_9BACT|nr:methylated-DNA--[protein]-cysteine S-methyltransferase [Chryseotalea sanaruensis]GCC52576.1 methylated-DNA--protein-cysteine methyltransferase [Chryseotalea sanaruensis]